MPLIHSGSKEAISENIRTLSHEIGKSPHVQSRRQAIAIAMETARRASRRYGGYVQKYADGGDVDDVLPPDTQAAAVQQLQTSPDQIPGPGPGEIAGTLGHMVAPRITDYLTKPRPPIQDVPDRPGKIPSTDDPRIPGAVAEGSMLTAGVVGGEAGLAAGLVGRGAGLLGRGFSRVPAMSDIDSRLLGSAASISQMPLEEAQAAGIRLTPDEKRAMEMERQRADIAQKGKEQEAIRAMETERQRKKDELEADLARQKANAELQTQQDAQRRYTEAHMTFRQTHPELSQALPYLGSALSFGLPYLYRYFRSEPAQNDIAQRWLDVFDKTQNALATGDKRVGTQGLHQLNQLYNTWQKKPSLPRTVTATSAIAPTEAALIPEEIDRASLPEDSPDKYAIDRIMTNPVEVGTRLGVGALQAGLWGGAGSKLPTPRRMVQPPIAETRGLLDAYKLPKTPLPIAAPKSRAKLPPPSTSRALTPYAAGGPVIARAMETARRRADGGGMASPPWFVRAEARNIGHVGPVMSAVPGRTDRHNINVGSGSYVLPAETVSHLGQSNTLAGFQRAGQMFGPGGPYGSGAMKIAHGSLPRPPKMAGLAYGGTSEGGSRGEGKHELVPVVVAGGEYIIAPEIVRAIGKGDIKEGHKILDEFVMQRRRDHLKTIKKLKPPVKE